MATTWQVQFHSDVISDDVGGSTLEEWWTVSNGEKSFCADYQDDAKLLCSALNSFNKKPLALKWVDAPNRTQWGKGMQEALLPLGKDNTLRLYAEKEVLHLVAQALNGG